MNAPAMLVDGHVHFHHCFTWPLFLAAAAANFARARRASGLPPECPGCLMFTEADGANSLERLRRSPADLRSAEWNGEPHDDGSVTFRRGKDTLLLVPGRQIATRERLEVLALGSTARLGAARPLVDVLSTVVAEGSVAVIPWGFGKWTGARGRMVRRLVNEGAGVPFCLGDNGGRAAALSLPGVLALARKRGIPVLGGSDPLPIPEHVSRPGSYGFVLEGVPWSARPGDAVVARIRRLRRSPQRFGELNTMTGMLRSQVSLRWRRLAPRVEA